jgi:hypothetical protein
VLDARLAQVGALDVAHDDVEPPVVLIREVDGHDVRVVERRCDLRLPLEPLTEVGVVGEVAAHDVHRDGPVQRELVAAVHRTHPATADHGIDPHAADNGADGHLGHARHYPAGGAAATGCQYHAHRRRSQGRSGPGAGSVLAVRDRPRRPPASSCTRRHDVQALLSG